MDKPELGANIRAKEFGFNPELAPCNHGSYGVPPKCVRAYQISLHELGDSDGDAVYREEYASGVPRMWRESLETVCKFIGTSYENTFFVMNVTAGMNAVINSVPLVPGEAILTSSVTYNAIKQICLKRANDTGATVLTIKLPDKSKAAVLKAYADFLNAHPNIKLVTLDHVTSNTAWVMPIKELIDLCRNNNILVCVDGAHAPGQVPLSVEQLEPDFYAGTFNKWLFSPRGAAFVWIRPKHHHMVHPPLTSHNYRTTLHRAFYMQGTTDFTPVCCVPAAIDFYQRIGGMAAVVEYNCNLVNEARDMLIKSWDTGTYPIPKEDEAPFMKNIRLPDIPGVRVTKRMDGEMLMDKMFEKFKVRCRISPIDGAFWVRICANVYNTMADYKRLDEAVCYYAKHGIQLPGTV